MHSADTMIVPIGNQVIGVDSRVLMIQRYDRRRVVETARRTIDRIARARVEVARIQGETSGNSSQSFKKKNVFEISLFYFFVFIYYVK